MTAPNLSTLALRSVKFFARTHIGIGLGVAAATAVILGALVVGDSVRGSLRKLVTDRLANIECILHARAFFEPGILSDLRIDGAECEIVPAIIFSSATVERRVDTALTRASKVQVLAASQPFWDGVHAEIGSPASDEILLNRLLATELGVSVGDEITILVNDPSGIPSDNPLGKREDRTLSVPRQKVVGILPDDGIGGVSFLLNQSAPRNVFASLETVQDILECGSKSNAALVLNQDPGKGATGQDISDQLNLQMRPAVEDYGLELVRHTRVFPDAELGESAEAAPQKIYDYHQLSSSQLIIDDPTSSAVVDKFGPEKATRLLTYLVNKMVKVPQRQSDRSLPSAATFEAQTTGTGRRLAAGPRPPLQPVITIGAPIAQRATNGETQQLSRVVPYSIVVGIDTTDDLPLEKHLTVDREELKVPYCWINSWLAEQLEAQPGDLVEASFFEPETVDGQEIERTLRFMVGGIVPIVEPVRQYSRRKPAVFDQMPTPFNDPNLTPSVPGITDQDSIMSWETPFKLEQDLIKPVDDLYYKNHRLTPKVFMRYMYASHPDLFSSRFGKTTAFRFSTSEFPEETALRNEIEDALLETRAVKGLTFAPIRQQQLKAASGTTPFDMLFISLSFFVIVAALMLVYLLFKLGIQQRTSELGILQAEGFTPQRVRNLLLLEFSIVAGVGALLGIVLGLLYARAIIAGLETWWIGAISVRFLHYFVTPQSLAIGALIGFLTSWAALYFGLNKACNVNPLSNLRGQLDDQTAPQARVRRINLAVSAFLFVGAMGLMFAALGQTGMARAGTFFGSGMLLLAACMFAARQLLESGARDEGDNSHLEHSGNIFYMAWRSIGRNPSRSLLSLSLLSVASFLIASMSVFQISPDSRGYGGFNLLAESSQPIYRNLGSANVRSEALGADADKLRSSTIIGMRARFGEDASCNNLFQVAQPTILGVPGQLRAIHDLTPDSVEFEWAKSSSPENPWNALRDNRATGAEFSPIPVILDQNTAMWSLKQGASLDSVIRLEFDNRVIYFRTVGLLANSVLQGKLLISQRNFEQMFPEISGYSFFLINSGQQEQAASVAETLEKGWADEGMDVQYSEDILAKFLGVQNTYISAFQSLGALGLLLGTFGLIAVQIRSVFERRREFAVMRAVGFSTERLASILTMETAILLGGGLLTGIVCSAVALVPYLLDVGPRLGLFSPIIMLASVVLIGFITSFVAVRAANKQSVLAGLRSE